MLMTVQNKKIILKNLRHLSVSYKIQIILAILAQQPFPNLVTAYLKQKYPSVDFSWRNMQDEQIINLSEQLAQYLQIKQRQEKQKIQQLKLLEGKKVQLIQKLKQMDMDIQTSNNERLQLKIEERRQLLKVHLNTQKEIEIKRQEQQLRQLKQINTKIDVIKQNISNKDSEYQSDVKIIKKYINKYAYLFSQQESKKMKQKQKQLIQKWQKYNIKKNIVKQKLLQIFSQYCRQNSKTAISFQQYNQLSKVMDLRIFLKYFKNYSFVQINKYRFKVTTVTKLFKSLASNGTFLNFQQFWKIHEQLFFIVDLKFSQKQIGDQDYMYKISSNLKEQFEKLQQLENIIKQQRSKQILKNIYSAKTQEYDLSSNYSKKQSVFSQRKSYERRNYISQIRRQIQNQQIQQKSPKKTLQINKKNSIKLLASIQNTPIIKSPPELLRNNSLSLVSIGNKSKISEKLPKLLKISTQQIQSKGIYNSLKRFAYHDLIAQQNKIKGLIGISNNNDDVFMNMYFKREQDRKLSEQKQKSLQRDKKRKEAAFNKLACSKQCSKNHVHNSEPYMRFYK